jgi:hypothetical protein
MFVHLEESKQSLFLIKKISIPWRLLQNASSYLKLCAGLYKAGLKEKVMGGATINSTMGSYPDDAGSAPTSSIAPYCS